MLHHALLLLDPRLWGSPLELGRRRPLFLVLRLRNMRDHIPWHQMHTRTYVYSCTVVSLGCVLAILSGELLLRCYLAQISLPIRRLDAERYDIPEADTTALQLSNAFSSFCHGLSRRFSHHKKFDSSCAILTCALLPVALLPHHPKTNSSNSNMPRKSANERTVTNIHDASQINLKLGLC